MKFATPAEQLLFSTVRVETKKARGVGSGTAFGYHYLLDDGGYHVFLVTNKHVVKDAIEGRLVFTQSSGTKEEEPVVGKSAEIRMTNFEAAWRMHPNPDVDIAILSAASALGDLEKAGSRVFLRAIPSDLGLRGDALKELDAVESVIFVGYPNGMYDTVNLTPIVRTGITATHPGLDYCGTKAFLIDASVFPGSSGSPVFLFNSGSYPLKLGAGPPGIAVGNRIAFLGILSTVFTRSERGAIRNVEIPTGQIAVATVKQMIDLGTVLKAELIDETIATILSKQATK